MPRISSFNPAVYAKAVAAVISAGLMAALPFLVSNNHLTNGELVNVVIASLGAVTVYLAPNLPGSWSEYTKSLVAAAVAAATVLASAVGAGSFSAVSSAEWVQVILAFSGALGVLAVPNVMAAVKTPGLAAGVQDPLKPPVVSGA